MFRVGSLVQQEMPEKAERRIGRKDVNETIKLKAIIWMH